MIDLKIPKFTRKKQNAHAAKAVTEKDPLAGSHVLLRNARKGGKGLFRGTLRDLSAQKKHFFRFREAVRLPEPSQRAENDPEEIEKGPNDVRRFMKRTAKTESGEKARVSYVLDEERIKEEEKYDGYYAVATNLDDPAKDILAVSHNRYKIEDCFRIMKTNFSGRPVFHWTPKRIKSHFLICYTALLVYRLLECRLVAQNSPVTTENLLKTLRNMEVINVHDFEYMAIYKGSKALDALMELSDLGLDRVHYHPKELNKKIKKIL